MRFFDDGLSIILRGHGFPFSGFAHICWELLSKQHSSMDYCLEELGNYLLAWRILNQRVILQLWIYYLTFHLIDKNSSCWRRRNFRQLSMISFCVLQKLNWSFSFDNPWRIGDHFSVMRLSLLYAFQSNLLRRKGSNYTYPSAFVPLLISFCLNFLLAFFHCSKRNLDWWLSFRRNISVFQALLIIWYEPRIPFLIYVLNLDSIWYTPSFVSSNSNALP